MRIIKWLNENQGFVMAALTFVYVLTTAIIAIIGLKANRLNQRNIETAIRLERSRSRPYVVFNITTWPKQVVHTVIHNVGQTSVYDVKVTLEPKLTRVINKEETQSVLISHTISFLPPGEKIEDYIGPSFALFEKYPKPIFEGSVEYRSADGEPYKEPFRLDLTFASDRNALLNDPIPDVLKKMDKSLASISESLKE